LKRRSTSWDDAEVEAAIRWWNHGLSAAQIAKDRLTSKTRSAILGKLFRLWDERDPRMKRPMRKGARRTRIWSDEDLLLLIRMSEPGPGEEVWDDEEIARHFRVDTDEIVSVRNAIIEELER
jgi:hypothetical protein